MEHFVVLSNTVLWKEETNMAVASMMTCKKPSIWLFHMTLEQDTGGITNLS